MTPLDRSTVPAFRQALTRVFPRNANTHWLNIASMLADAAFETDIAGRFTAFGHSAVLGIPATQLVGRNIADFCKLLGNNAFAISFAAIFGMLGDQGTVWRGAVALQRGDGTLGTYQILLAPKPADAGKARKTAISAMAGVYGLLIERDVRDMQFPLTSGASRTIGMLDAQTGLWAAATFAEETARRFDRLDVEGIPGTLILLAFSGIPAIGYHSVALRLAEDLREISRPTDIVGRLNATTFAIWCDGMDDLTGAERAARFCEQLPAALPGNPSISVGLVARWPGNVEEPQALIRQASTALQHAERVARAEADARNGEPVGRGTWRVWNRPA